MKLYNIVLCLFFALASFASAQTLPLGQILTQDGNSIILAPFQSDPAFGLPELQGYGLIVSVAPADVSATVIDITVALTVEDGTRLSCRIVGTVNPHQVFTPLGFSTAQKVVSITGVTLLIANDVSFGRSNPKSADGCIPAVLPHPAKTEGN